ncbi:opacity protein-like surface antigen [Chryseobacterium ginsenosidimutans]|uniref:porin family protein n=1 Tax=Chryseobacterium ginsenosidimutans TaxID=687846 RepID=UPI00277D6E1D|nr:porin family protein [Chryseobacterium ginsenosidimutans]MDQ0593341.1 opacity protein-like surface antigen [Chryseobacterium ginsenosidimutans]
MKKNFLFLLSLTISTIVNAQNSDSGSKLNFGIKGGYTLSTMKFFDTTLDSKSYFYAGIVAEQPISSKVSIQAEALYTQIGGKQDFPVVDFTDSGVIERGNVQFDYQLTQIQVPISAKYYFIPNLSASVGMNFGVNLSEKVKTDQVVNGSTSHDYENVKTLNLFPFLGAEYKINDHFFADARYHFNFIGVSKSGLDTKIGFLQAGVGYRFK